METCKSLSELNNSIDKEKKIQKFELVVSKKIAKENFSPKDGSFDMLWKGKIYITYKNGILHTYQFGKGIDY